MPAEPPSARGNRIPDGDKYERTALGTLIIERVGFNLLVLSSAANGTSVLDVDEARSCSVYGTVEEAITEAGEQLEDLVTEARTEMKKEQPSRRGEK